ncbi:MAG: hypothetical protein K9H84_04170 [Bacteroidales bacterium]|nr:hypothetical protein [Bacteroidales bacterium]
MSNIKRKNLTKFAVTFVFISVGFCSHAQNYFWKAGLWNIADNREYFNDFQEGETILVSRLNGSIGVKMDSIHQFVAGLDYMFEYGNSLNAVPISPILYYHLNKNPFSFYFGSFPREGLLNYPLFLMKEKFLYYNPSIKGLHFKASGSSGHQTLWIDWLQKQTLNQREAFLYGASGRLNLKWLFLEHYFLMYHKAKSQQPINEHISDNGGFLARIGININTSGAFPDTLYMAAGPAFKIDQLRGVYDMNIQTGFSGMFTLRKDFAGIKATYFHGEGQEVIYGDPLYQAENYGRLDVFFLPFENSSIKARFEYSLHFINDIIDHSQSIVISVDLQNSFNNSSSTD